MLSCCKKLNRKNQVDAAFFERLKGNHKRTSIEALKNSKNQILNIPADKVNVAKQFYEELNGSISTYQTLCTICTKSNCQ